MRRPLRAVLIVVTGLTLASAIHASHLNGIRATVAGLDAGTMTADVYLTAYTDEGVPFTTTNTTNVRTSPIVYWGEGEMTSNLTIYAVPPGTSPIGSLARYRGAFSHTYSGLGPFTLQVIQDSCCAGYWGEITAEGYTGNPWEGEYFATGTPIPSPTAQQYVGFFSNTTVVDFSQVPAMSRAVIWLIAGLLALGGALMVWRGVA